MNGTGCSEIFSITYIFNWQWMTFADLERIDALLLKV